MWIPDLVHGTHRQVRRRSLTLIDALRSGVTWADLWHGESLNSSESIGLLVLGGPSPLISDEPHFHVYVPMYEIGGAILEGRLPASLEERIFYAALAEPWSLLGLLSTPNRGILFAPDRHRPLVDATIAWWPTLDGEGARYTVGLREGSSLWSLTTNLHFVLARLGVPTDRLTQPLPTDGITGVLASAKAHG